MIINNELYNKFKIRIYKLVLTGKMTKEKEKSLMQHIEADINQGGNELENHVAMSDETLIQ